jgi:hypothetical protein
VQLLVIVVELPRTDVGLRILYTRELVLVRAFIPQFCSESLHEAILPRLPAEVVRARERVDDGSIGLGVVDKVHRRTLTVSRRSELLRDPYSRA